MALASTRGLLGALGKSKSCRPKREFKSPCMARATAMCTGGGILPARAYSSVGGWGRAAARRSGEGLPPEAAASPAADAAAARAPGGDSSSRPADTLGEKPYKARAARGS